MFSIETDLTPAIRQLQSLEDTLARQKPRMLAEIGRFLVGRAYRDFLTKSRGGTGEDGQRWKPLTPREQQRKARAGQQRLGVRTGELGRLSNIRATSGGTNAYGKRISRNEVVVDFLDQPTANFFNFHRRLLPNKLPAAWRKQAERIVDDHLTRFT